MFSDELQITGSQLRSTFKYGNDASFSKSLLGAILIELEPAFLLAEEEVEVLLGAFLFDLFLVLSNSRGGRAVDAKAVGFLGCWLKD